MNQQELIQKIKPILERHQITKAELFGSYARGEAGPKSDVDVLIEFQDRKSLFDLVGIEHELEDVLGKEVDVVTYRSVYPPLKPYIFAHTVRII